MGTSLDEIARLVEGRLVGDGTVAIRKVAPIEEADVGAISFVANRKYRRFLSTTKASAVIVPPDMEQDAVGTYIVSPNPYLSIQRVIRLLYGDGVDFPKGVHETAILGADVRLGTDVSLGPYAVIEDGCELGNGVIIGAGCVVGRGSRIGDRTILYPNVTVYHGTEIGQTVIVHSGAVIGSDGFGFAWDGKQYHKIPQVGRVIIEEDVEIGANTAIDRAALGVTRIGRGTKIDNLVQIGHNATVGCHTVIAGQTGISGSTKIGNGVQIGGQAGLSGHLEVGDRARIGAQAGVSKSVPEGIVVSGYPARPHRDQVRLEAALGKVPELLKIVKEQGKRIEALEEALRQVHRK
ncbi:MAG: UDP-3-O-(3-hydroxymyristoyl)glucosamine N-acyltransferase [Candidatus Latescibacterota bacterium]